MRSAQKDAIPRRLRAAVYRRDGRQCRYCGTRRGPFELDHVYPESKGGATTLENLVVACEKCNLRKAAKVGIWPKPIGYFAEQEAQQEELARRSKIIRLLASRALQPPLPSIFLPLATGLVVAFLGLYKMHVGLLGLGFVLAGVGLLAYIAYNFSRKDSCE